MATLVSNMRRLLPVLLCVIFAACNPNAVAYTDGVEITIDVEVCRGSGPRNGKNNNNNNLTAVA